MKLAVYGTLRNGSKNTGILENSSLVYPGHNTFPAVIQNQKGSGTVVEVHEVSEEDLKRYDMKVLTLVFIEELRLTLGWITERQKAFGCM